MGWLIAVQCRYSLKMRLVAIVVLYIFYCSIYIGLYPQFAIADEFNHAKSGPEQLFHTRVKPFNVLHPNSIFASNPEFLTLENVDIVHVGLPGFCEKYPVSSKHQLLVYMSLLETNKPYVVNAVRMPALQTLLLFSHTIDTNCNFTRLTFDSWIEVHFVDAEQGQNMVYKTTKLRYIWNEFSNLKLRERLTDKEPDEEIHHSDLEKSLDKQEELETKLSRGLIEFMNTETLFSIRRLLPGDLKVMYTNQMGSDSNAGPLPVQQEENPFEFDQNDSTKFKITSNDKKGGVYLTNYVTYDCLENTVEEQSAFCISWQCPVCEDNLYHSPLQRISHYRNCCENQEMEINAKIREEKQLRKQRENPLATEYQCAQCNGKTYYFTSVQLLRHKNTHKDGKV